MKFKHCLKCGKKVSRNCHLGYCNKCRDRSGKNNPFYGKKHKKETIEKAKKKLSKISKKLWQNPVYRQKIISGISKPRIESFKKEQSERMIQWYQDNPNQRDIRSQKMKESWKQGKIKPTINSINESKPERKLREELIKLLPNKNIRKTTIKINGKWFYPDIRVDKNIIIEFYGNYWHANPRIYKENNVFHHGFTAKQIWDNDKKRIKRLKNAGFKIFIVWQDKYQNNKKKVIKNIIKKL